MGKEFSNAVAQYLSADFHNAYQHLHGRTVADILAEANASERGPLGQIVAEGDRDGTHYTLYEAPDVPSDDNEDCIAK